MMTMNPDSYFSIKVNTVYLKLNWSLINIMIFSSLDSILKGEFLVFNRYLINILFNK